MFKRKAVELASLIGAEFPDLPVEYVADKPRRGAFEFVAVDADGNEHVLWTGLKLGPPRRLKFPDDAAAIIAKLKEHAA
jgi:selT/selW/selH-like putative selenoprotein